MPDRPCDMIRRAGPDTLLMGSKEHGWSEVRRSDRLDEIVWAQDISPYHVNPEGGGFFSVTQGEEDRHMRLYGPDGASHGEVSCYKSENIMTRKYGYVCRNHVEIFHYRDYENRFYSLCRENRLEQKLVLDDGVSRIYWLPTEGYCVVHDHDGGRKEVRICDDILQMLDDRRIVSLADPEHPRILAEGMRGRRTGT